MITTVALLTRPSRSPSMAQSTKSTSHPRMRQVFVRRSHRGRHMHARPVVGAGGEASRPAAPTAPAATSGLGPRPTASRSAAADACRLKFGRHTRRLTSVERPSGEGLKAPASPPPIESKFRPGRTSRSPRAFGLLPVVSRTRAVPVEPTRVDTARRAGLQGASRRIAVRSKHVRTVYRPSPTCRGVGTGRGSHAEPQLHRNRAHPAGPHSRGRRRRGQGAGVVGYFAGGCPPEGGGDHRPRPAVAERTHPVHTPRQEGFGAEPPGG